MSGTFSVVEELFGPVAHRARQEIEEQRRGGPRRAAPGDPPDLAPEPGAAGRARYRRSIVIRREPD